MHSVKLLTSMVGRKDQFMKSYVILCLISVYGSMPLLKETVHYWAIFLN